MCSSTSDTKMAETPKSTRRSNKPLMERKRRERINHCLNELKNLVLTAQRKDPTRYSKLEKADILEMTVRHVQALHRQDVGAVRNQSSSLSADATAKYSAGFRKCASEVSRFLSSVNGLPPDLHARVLSHLSAATNTHYVKSQDGDKMIAPATPAVNTSPSKYQPPTHQNNKDHNQQQIKQEGVPIARAKMVSGQLALVVPPWAGASANGSPPTNATSPEAAGAPSSPESARGSPSMVSSSPDEFHHHEYPLVNDNTRAIKYQPNPTKLISSGNPIGPGCLSPYSTSSATRSTYSSTTVSSGRMQVDLQVAPLDLATSNRRYLTDTPSPKRQRATTVSVESMPSQPPQAGPAVHPRDLLSPSRQDKQRLMASSTQSKGVAVHHSPKEVRNAPYPIHNPSLQNPHWRPW